MSLFVIQPNLFNYSLNLGKLTLEHLRWSVSFYTIRPLAHGRTVLTLGTALTLGIIELSFG